MNRADKPTNGLTETIGRFDFIDFGRAEKSCEIIEKSHIASRETIDGLPVVTYAIEFRRRISLAQGFEKVVAVNGYILKFIDNDIFIRHRMRCPAKFGRLQDGIRKVDLSATAQSLRIAFIHGTENVFDYELTTPVIGFVQSVSRRLSMIGNSISAR